MIILGKELKKKKERKIQLYRNTLCYISINKQICVCMWRHVYYMCMDLYVFLHINLTKYNKN